MDKGFSAKAFLPELVLMIAVAVLLFMNVGTLDIDPYSEFFHLESAKESLAVGRFWTPVLNGHDYLVRSPLWTWVVICFFKLLGVTLYAARFPAILLSLGALALIYMLTLELTKSRFSAFFSAAVLATGWGFFQMGSLSTANTLELTLYLGFLWAFLRWKDFASRRNVIPVEMNVLSLTMGILLGLLLLNSGSVSVLLLLAIAVFHLLLGQNIYLLSRLNVGLLSLPLALIPLPWLLWVSLKSGKATFMFDYLVLYPVQKLFGGGIWQTLKGDWLFHLKRLPLDLLPWLLFIPVAVQDAIGFMGRGGQQAQNWMNWLLLWFVMGFIVYSLSVFQEPSQMLPFYAPLAMIVGCYLAQVVELSGGKTPERYEPILITYIMLMMALAVILTIIIFQVVPSDYVAGFWQLPGMAVIRSFEFGDKLFELPEAFPLWKLWLIPGPFVLLIGGFTLFILQAGRKMTLTPLALTSTMVLFLLFIKAVYLPIMQRPVPRLFAQQINKQAKPGDQVLLYSIHPDLKRVLFFIQPDKLPRTHLIRDKEKFGQYLEQGRGQVHGVIRERSYFEDLDYRDRTMLRIDQYNWRWDMTRLGEMAKLLIVRLPDFEKMRSEMLYFQSLPAETIRTLRQEAAEEDAQKD